MTQLRNIFGEPIALPPKRGKHYVKPSGHAAPPGSGPKGETCKTCRHLVRVQGGAKRYPKCGMAKGGWTHGRASDVLVSSPACSRWEGGDA